MGLVLKDLGNEYAVWDALMQISAEYPIKSYLEVGTRYGDSLLRVLASKRLDRIVIADIWHESYFGPNHNGTGFDRSHKHVERMLRGLGYWDFDGQPVVGYNGEDCGIGKSITFLDGDSAKTVPTLSKNQPFDLILVDGDHDPEPARADLWNCWPLVSPGGFLVFDDIQSSQHMMELWTYFIKNAPDVAENHIRVNKKFGVAVAIRQDTALETSKVRSRVLKHFLQGKGIDVGCSRDPITRTCVAFDQSDLPEVTHRGDARALPFTDAEFDWVWSSHCLEDIEDTEVVLREWLRVLKPGGKIGLYVPHLELYKGTNTEHKHGGFTPECLSEILIHLGCEIIESFVDDESSGPQPRYSSCVIARKS